MKIFFRLLFFIYTFLLVWVSVNPILGFGDVKYANTPIRIDYLLHVFAFFVLPLIGYLANGSNGKFKLWIILIAVSFVIAVGTEFLQIVVPERKFNLYDTFSNLIGLILGITAVLTYEYFIKKQKITK
ncbi:MAG: hypothetical protein CVT98_02710 [Bacteroidetes bacterium HGW-Bacteroidetes-15]|nr:MAG: hypothetical protein CVT98_02710 [Bacteroidetes bacterium HGW-Bacteroidetes-15]